MRFVLAKPSDPSRLNELHDWYNTYSAAITVPGCQRRAQQRAVRDDLRHRLPRPRDRLARHRALTRLPQPPVRRPACQAGFPALRASYALVGSQLQPGPHGPLAGIHVIVSNGSGDAERQHREAQILQTGLFYCAARFRIIEGSPAPADRLEVFETDDPDPLHAYPRAIRHTPPAPQIQPQLSRSFRLASARKTNGV